MESSYLIRYGLSRQVGRFTADCAELTRGQTVVVRSHRGMELGEVLIKTEAAEAVAAMMTPSGIARVLRPADGDDLERALRLEQERPRRFALCQRFIEDRNAPLELLDVELLLGDERTVLHYLGPPRSTLADLVTTLRSSFDFDVMFESAGVELEDEAEAHEGSDSGHGCGHCGAAGGGCGLGGGDSGTAGSGSGHGGCSDCGVKRILAARRAVVAH